MIKAIARHQKFVEDLLVSHNHDTNWTEVLSDHDRQLFYFQSERLIHLLVTLFVSLFALLSFFASFFINNLMIHFLTLILIILSLAYLFHYYQLENGIQSLYPLSEKLAKHTRENSQSQSG